MAPGLQSRRRQSPLEPREEDVSPDPHGSVAPDYIHVPQAPRIERSPIASRGPANEWQMWGVYGVNKAGDRVGISNHTWSHLDAPFHLLPAGAGFDRLDPRHYLALRTRVVDLAHTGPGRRRPSRVWTITPVST